MEIPLNRKSFDTFLILVSMLILMLALGATMLADPVANIIAGANRGILIEVAAKAT